MRVPLFNQQQYLSSSSLNSSIGTIYSAISEFFNQYFSYGFINMDDISLQYSGLNVTITANQGFALRSGTGLGVVNSQTQYTVNFSSLVPSTGTIEVYLVGSLNVVNIDPFVVVPPPPGDASYSPAASAYTGYANQQYQIYFSASTTLPDNVNSFVLGVGSLGAGASTISINTEAAIVSALIPQLNIIPITSSQTVTIPGVYSFNDSGLTVTLPQPNNIGEVFGFEGAGTVSGSFVGLYSSTGTASSMTLGANDTLLLVSNGSAWMIFGGTFAAMNQLTFPLPIAAGGTGTVSPSLTAGNGLTVTGSFPNQQYSLSTPVSISNGGTGTSSPSLIAGNNISVSGSFPNQTIGISSPVTIGNGGTGATNALSALQNLGVFANNTTFISSSTTLTTAYNGYVIQVNNSATITLPPPAAQASMTLAFVAFSNGVVIEAPSGYSFGGGGQLNGLTSFTMNAMQDCILVSNGGAWIIVSVSSPLAKSSIPMMIVDGTPGNYSYTVPAGIGNVWCRVWGGGGNGSNSAGGGSGAYAEGVINVAPYNTVNVTVGGAEGTSSVTYGSSISIVANGGSAGSGGTASISGLSGGITLYGYYQTTGYIYGSLYVPDTGWGSPMGGQNVAGHGTTAAQNGMPGTFPGGGGSSGAFGYGGNGGAGANGLVVLVWL